MPFVKVSSGNELFYAIPTCLTSNARPGEPHVDPDKPTIIFIHAVSCDSRSWLPQLEEATINNFFNCVVFDVHFMGLTRTIHDWTPGREAIPTPSEGELPHDSPIMTLEDMAEDFAEAFKKLQLPVSHLVGNGVNNAICYYLLLNYGDMFKSAAFLSPAALGETDHNKLQFADIWRSFLDYGMEDVMEAMAGFYSLFFGPSEAYNKERRETWYQLWGSLLPGEQFKRYVFGQWVSYLVMKKPVSSDAAREGFKVPCLIVSGTDHLIHPHAHNELEGVLADSKACPWFESHRLGDAPTMIGISHDSEVNSILRTFLTRVEGTVFPQPENGRVCYDPGWQKPYDFLIQRYQSLSSPSEAAPAPKRSFLRGLASALNRSRAH